MSLTKEERTQFFATKSGEPTRISMKGQSLKLANLPEANRRKILDRLAKKDEVMGMGKLGILPGLKIDGKQVTRDNIKDFELKPKEVKVEKKVKEEKYIKSDLEELSFKELKVIGKKLGTTDRSKKNLIKEILKLQ